MTQSTHAKTYRLSHKYLAFNTANIILYMKIAFAESNQACHCTRRITPKRVTSLRCPSPRHSAKGHSYLRPEFAATVTAFSCPLTYAG